MLQILTGRFFDGSRTVREEPTEAVLSSNLHSFSPVETSVGTLRRSLYGEGEVGTYVFQFTNRYQTSGDKDILLLARADEAVEQFRAICCLWFRCLVHPNRSFVESLIDPKARYVDTYFDLRREIPAEEREGFRQFLNDITSLPREKYLRVIACVRAFCDSIEAIQTNFDVAYSMLVYMLEALSKAADEKFEPTWDDYEEGQRLKIDKLSSRMDAAVAGELRDVLINTPHLRLSKRFVDFICKNVKDTFFTSEAVGRAWAIRKSELPRLLKNVYTARSGYVHDLQEALEDLRHLCYEPNAETIRAQHDVFLAYAGLVRLSRHVLISFVTCAPKLERETVNWRAQLPGMAIVELSPEYWIHRTDGFTEDTARHRFGGFIAYFMDLFTKPSATMIPLRPLMDRIDSMLTTAKEINRPALLAMYWLYNVHIVPEKAVDGWQSKFDAAIEADGKCRIEYLAMTTITQNRLCFDAKTSEQAYREYVKQRHKPRGTNLPPRLEVCIRCHIANLYLEEGTIEEYRRLLDEAIADSPGFSDLQRTLVTARDCASQICIAPLLGQPMTSTEQPAKKEEPETYVI